MTSKWCSSSSLHFRLYLAFGPKWQNYISCWRFQLAPLELSQCTISVFTAIFINLFLRRLVCEFPYYKVIIGNFFLLDERLAVRDPSVLNAHNRYYFNKFENWLYIYVKYWAKVGPTDYKQVSILMKENAKPQQRSLPYKYLVTKGSRIKQTPAASWIPLCLSRSSGLIYFSGPREKLGILLHF